MKAGDVRVIKNNLSTFKTAIKNLTNAEVVVGIPGKNNARKGAAESGKEEFDSMSNASIGYIQEFGSDIANIPPRPFLMPGIRRVSKEVALEFKKAAQNAFTDPNAVYKYYTRAGIIATNSVKQVFGDQGPGWQTPSSTTLSMRKQEGFKGTKALIRTGQLRNSITFVVGNR